MFETATDDKEDKEMYKTTTVLSVLVVLAGAAFARTNVSITSSGFVPAKVLIQLNDDVRWTNNDTVPHTVTSDSGLWNSGNVGPGQKFERVFSTAGGFKYHCTIHPAFTGTVNVANTPVEPASIGRVKALFR